MLELRERHGGWTLAKEWGTKGLYAQEPYRALLGINLNIRHNSHSRVCTSHWPSELMLKAWNCHRDFSLHSPQDSIGTEISITRLALGEAPWILQGSGTWAARDIVGDGSELHWWVPFSHSGISNSLWPHGLQHARLPCPSPTLEPTQIHVCCISDAIQPSHPPTFNLSQHQCLFKWVSSSHQVAKVLEFQLSTSPSFQWTLRTDLL